MAGCLRSGQIDEVPGALLARAELNRIEGHTDAALADLDRSEQICTRCGLKLFFADTHLERARLLALSNPDGARKYLALGRELVEKCGYHRRDGEVADPETRLSQV